MNKKNQEIPTPCQTKKNHVFFLRHIMEFWKLLLTKFRPKKRLIILITYYSQYSCKKNQEKKTQKNHTVFIATKYNWSRTTTTLQNTYNITYYTICCTYYIHIKRKRKEYLWWNSSKNHYQSYSKNILHMVTLYTFIHTWCYCVQ